MENPKALWTVKSDRARSKESLGFELCMQPFAPSWLFGFTVRKRQYWVSGPSRVLVVGELQSVMQAMAAAERAAAPLTSTQWKRAAPQQPQEPAWSAVLRNPAPGGSAEEAQSGSADCGITVVPRPTPHEVRELSGA